MLCKGRFVDGAEVAMGCVVLLKARTRCAAICYPGL